MSDLKEDGQDVVYNYSLLIIPGEFWTHYKGGVYQILTLGVKEDTGEACVVYKSLKYGTTWIRTIFNWMEIVKLPDGTTVQRFKKGAP